MWAIAMSKFNAFMVERAILFSNTFINSWVKFPGNPHLFFAFVHALYRGG